MTAARRLRGPGRRPRRRRRSHWSRRHSAALVKLLALAPGRSLHREQVIDALWPDLGIDEAAPRLHKAAHYARKALGHRDAVVLSAETVRLCPDDDVHIDATRFQQYAESAVADGGIAAAKAALASYGGELLPQDLYEPWAEQPRLHLGRLNAELLHQAEDWHQVLAADPTDEPAHLALAERYVERGDRAGGLAAARRARRRHAPRARTGAESTGVGAATARRDCGRSPAVLLGGVSRQGPTPLPARPHPTQSQGP